ncbi:MAG: hypothetical protein GY754_38865 [bacterium]|nr:hypothetical protein [bacterium]
MIFVIFEDNYPQNFYPLSLTKPLWELKCGIYSFRERFEIFIADNFSEVNNNAHKICYFTREYLAPYYREKYPELNINDYSVFESDEELLLIDSTLFPVNSLAQIAENSILLCENQPAAARISSKQLNSGLGSISEMIQDALTPGNGTMCGIPSECSLEAGEEPLKASYIWDLVSRNSRQITADFELLRGSENTGNSTNNSVTLIGESNLLYIGDGAQIDPFVVVDTMGGPVIIEAGARIHSFTRIEGPVYIGKNAIILGAKVREGTSIGECCRIGGEVEESIFHSFSNKYHDGFIGHSYVGEWVNMGALTTNSDLKNNYKGVRVYIPGGRTDTGKTKIGTFIGDFAKTSIGTLINTGSVIGTGAMVVHSGSMTPAHVPPFSWYINSVIEDRPWIENCIETAAVAAGRRGVEFSGVYADLLRHVFSITAESRKKGSV